MKTIKVGAAVLNQTPMDWGGNLKRILQAMQEARSAEISVLCLPEMCITGYGCDDWFHSAGVLDLSWDVLMEILPESKGLALSVGLPLLYQGGVFAAVCLVVDGRIAGFAVKQFLAGDGIHYEPRWFKPWTPGIQGTLIRDGVRYPLGDVYFDCGGIRIGFEICEDAWVGNRPGGELARRGIDLIMNPSASHFAFGKIVTRKHIVLEGSRAFGVTYLYANLLGNEAGRTVYDGGALIASGGRLLAFGPRFSYRDVALTSAVIDLDTSRMAQARSASFKPDLVSGDEHCVQVPFVYPSAALPALRAPELPGWEDGPWVKEEEFIRSEALALFDYLRKSAARGFVVSLSGGADSSAVACLVAFMVHLGVDELGLEGFRSRLAHIPDIEPAHDSSALIARLLTCVYQGTENSSDVTRTAASAVARAVGASYLEFEVGALVNAYVQMVGTALGRPLSWDRDDVSLQNIQARVRGPGVWMVANLKQALLLSTSNRSEAAVGYATMDGDTCGGLSPIAGIDKAYLRKWLVWLEKVGPAGHGPIPALEYVNKQQPTAELRPPSASQTDEADLMPYEVLDSIERFAIRDKKSPLEVYMLVKNLYGPEYARDLGLWVERFFRLWCRNQWKRERYAPSFYLDEESLDPRTWCRFPILSGGFATELEELRVFLASEAQS